LKLLKWRQYLRAFQSPGLHHHRAMYTVPGGGNSVRSKVGSLDVSFRKWLPPAITWGRSRTNQKAG
jgi:hypothetical protein